MPEQGDEGEADRPAQGRWTAVVTFFLIVAISGGAFAVALFDRSGDGAAAPTAPTPPAASTPPGLPGSGGSPTPSPGR